MSMYAPVLYPHRYTLTFPQTSLQLSKASYVKIHSSLGAEILHRVSEFVLLPARGNVQLFSRVLMPLAGAAKDHRLAGLVIRVTALALWILTLPLAFISSALGLAMRFIDHRYRPALCYLHNPSSHLGKRTQDLLLTEAAPLHIRTHNVGFVTTSMSTCTDMRPPTQRAHEIVSSITQDPLKPDIIFFQEVFHEDASKILCEGIKEEYPHIIHSVAPHILGFNSGSLVASKYPIEHVEFTRFDNMIGPERLAPRGVIKIRLQSKDGPLLIYGAHTQAMIGEARAKVRKEQIKTIQALMKQESQAEPHSTQLLVGDLNISTITPWGDTTLQPKGQAESETFQYLNDHFEDLYLKDHEAATGKRTSGNPEYLTVDNQRLGEQLVEPTGSWYHGPLASPGVLYSLKMQLDRQHHKRPTPEPAPITIEKNLWGTKQWRSQQPANTARFDYILTPKTTGIHRLDGRVEIRRPWVPENAQSASSDHLPVDGKIWRVASP
jgi:endonuclease/exonuclease/phosphatase family metal-dependent hydrolase